MGNGCGMRGGAEGGEVMPGQPGAGWMNERDVAGRLQVDSRLKAGKAGKYSPGAKQRLGITQGKNH